MYASTLLVAGLAALTAAYTTPVGSQPQGNPITKPGLNEIVPVGAAYPITWTPTSGGTVTLLLLRGPSDNAVPLYPIVEKTPNTGSFSWTPSASLQPDTTRYGIQLIDDATGFYQYTTQFGISNPGYTNTTSSASSSASITASASGSLTTSYVVPTKNATTCVYCLGNSTVTVGPTATPSGSTSTSLVIVTPAGTTTGSGSGASATTTGAATVTGAAGKVFAAPALAGLLGLAAFIL